MLLAAGADVNARNLDCRTPLHEAVKNAGSPSGLECVELLLEGGADETLADKSGKVPADAIRPRRHEELYGTSMFDRPLELARELLASAPADRAWRRRGVLVLYRALPDRVPLLTSYRHTRTKMARRTRSQAKCGFGEVLAVLCTLTADNIFRKIIGFL